MEVKESRIAELIVNARELEQLNAVLEDDYQDGDYIHEEVSPDFLATFNIKIQFEFDAVLLIVVD